MRMRRMIFAAVFSLLTAKAAFAGQPTECDRLAGSPTDPNRLGEGIGLYGIEPVEAIAACETALAADADNPRLLFNLSRAHLARWLIDQQSDEEQALAGRNLEAAADRNYPAAMVVEAKRYWLGNAGFPQDVGEAMRLLDKAALSDAAEVKQVRRLLFLQPSVSEKRSEAQIRFVKQAADTNDPDALFALGMQEDDDRQQAEAVRLWQRAAALGSAEAAMLLATDYLAGDGGLPQDQVEAQRLMHQAAVGDNPGTRTILAGVYEQGLQVPKDENLAARLYRQASDEGNDDAQYHLGRFYEAGRGGLPQDAHEAARLYKLAAEQGNEDATLALARYMAEGQGGYEADKTKALEFLKRAAHWSTKAKEELTKIGG
ncbi:hypothetical protein DPM33_31990 [Mesorhizobium hawassense]|uniref:Sel1 repeat family protein n=1 Tax=Mesorhizobium hawassense TaxID=1209954 RepID=A0A330HBZ5_9HYPH|nr:tetratricopeptide repeat protein [Mesorhizobium hawassense]RAZ84149.1 hypothetical protein DPM33_31990 [Mesorhizobium hawassense]